MQLALPVEVHDVPQQHELRECLKWFWGTITLFCTPVQELEHPPFNVTGEG